MNIFLNPARVFLIFTLLGGTVLVFLTPPFQVPDEPDHFRRAYSISEGNFMPSNQDGSTGAILPSSINRIIGLLIYDDGHYPHHSRADALAVPLDRDKKIFHRFRTSSGTSPLTYMPQAFGIFLGRIAGAAPLTLVYLGRISNLLICSTIIYFALCTFPALRWFTLLLVFSPMAATLRSSLSPDALTFTVALMLAASCAKLCFSPADQHKQSDIVILIISSAALCLTKIPYALLVFVLAALPAIQIGAKWNRTMILRVVSATSFCALMISLLFAVHPDQPIRSETIINPGAQIRGSLYDPIHFCSVFFATYWELGRDILKAFIGNLGWMNVSIPPRFHYVYFFSLLTLMFVDSQPSLRITLFQRLIFAIIFGVTIITISAAIYATWTPVGARLIDGIQGRYFHSAAAFFGWIFITPYFARLLSRLGFKVTSLKLAVFTSLALCLSFTTTFVVLYRYYY